MRFVRACLALVIAAALLVVAMACRSPELSALRPWILPGLIVVPTGLVAITLARWRARRAAGPGTPVARPAARLAGILSVMLATSALVVAVTVEAQFQWSRLGVLAADPVELERLGRHVIVGYRDAAELRALIERRAIAGVFITARNVEGKSIAEVKDRIRAMQDIRARQQLPPLWIATDQEGGAVSRLSPPLERLPPLSEIIAAHADPAERRAAARRYASVQAEALADLGVNLNFAPVIDVNHHIVKPDDRYTRIYQRAISTDPGIIADVADEYCATLRRHRVLCTLKHFPGLGRVAGDTHSAGADLDASIDELARTDWVPFRALMNDDAVTMVGHARLVAVDRERPASLSPSVIGGLLRDGWSYEGVLITDDVTMAAAYDSREGAPDGSVTAISAGMDLILVSYDPDQLYPVMRALLKAARDGRLPPDILDRSDRRLSRMAGRAISRGETSMPNPHGGCTAEWTLPRNESKADGC